MHNFVNCYKNYSQSPTGTNGTQKYDVFVLHSALYFFEQFAMGLPSLFSVYPSPVYKNNQSLYHV
jgi:hypothetical protein